MISGRENDRHSNQFDLSTVFIRRYSIVLQNDFESHVNTDKASSHFPIKWVSIKYGVTFFLFKTVTTVQLSRSQILFSMGFLCYFLRNIYSHFKIYFGINILSKVIPLDTIIVFNLSGVNSCFKFFQKTNVQTTYITNLFLLWLYLSKCHTILYQPSRQPDSLYLTFRQRAEYSMSRWSRRTNWVDYIYGTVDYEGELANCFSINFPRQVNKIFDNNVRLTHYINCQPQPLKIVIWPNLDISQIDCTSLITYNNKTIYFRWLDK